MNPRSERSMTVPVSVTENEAIAADQAADKLAAVGVCYNGPDDCPGRQPPTDNGGSIFRRHNREYRPFAVYAGGATIAPRKYICRFCEKIHVFPVEVPKQN